MWDQGTHPQIMQAGVEEAIEQLTPNNYLLKLEINFTKCAFRASTTYGSPLKPSTLLTWQVTWTRFDKITLRVQAIPTQTT